MGNGWPLVNNEGPLLYGLMPQKAIVVTMDSRAEYPRTGPYCPISIARSSVMLGFVALSKVVQGVVTLGVAVHQSVHE